MAGEAREVERGIRNREAQERIEARQRSVGGEARDTPHKADGLVKRIKREDR